MKEKKKGNREKIRTETRDLRLVLDGDTDDAIEEVRWVASRETSKAQKPGGSTHRHRLQGCAQRTNWVEGRESVWGTLEPAKRERPPSVSALARR
jgi:hypothetical protein